jgi:hypothetical protein
MVLAGRDLSGSDLPYALCRCTDSGPPLRSHSNAESGAQVERPGQNFCVGRDRQEIENTWAWVHYRKLVFDKAPKASKLDSKDSVLGLVSD